MSKTAIVFDHPLRYEEDGSVWWVERGKGRQYDKPIGTLTYQGYLQCHVNKVQKKVHHVVWFIHHGYWPESLDHINKDKADNRIENLREGASKNNHNRDMPLGTSGLPGAHKSNKKGKPWKSSIKVDGTQKHLGYFKTAEEAHVAYLKEKERCFV